MILLTHIVIALSSVIYTVFVLISPSKSRLNVSYALLALTIGTGTYLVVSKPAHILETCIMGLTYIGLMLLGIFAARYRLTKIIAK